MSASPARPLTPGPAAPGRAPRPARVPDHERGRTPATSRRVALRVVADGPRRGAKPRAPFVIALCALLVSSLVGVLVLNSALTKDAYTVHNLKQQLSELSNQEQALRTQVRQESAPGALGKRATDLGMVPSVDPAFTTADGQVLGVPTPAPSPPVAAANGASQVRSGGPASAKPDGGTQ